MIWIYRIIFNLFVVEKIFKGVYFLLRDVNKTLAAATRIKEIKSFYGDEFSEKILCYKVMKSIYPDKCIRFSGKELADMKIDAALMTGGLVASALTGGLSLIASAVAIGKGYKDFRDYQDKVKQNPSYLLWKVQK